jgi:hypothetical protein
MDAFAKKARMVSIACLVLLIVNAIGLLATNHFYGEELRQSMRYHDYLKWRALALRPFTVLSYAGLVGYGLYWVFKPRDRRVSEMQRLAVLAFVLSIAAGMLLLALIPL